MILYTLHGGIILAIVTRSYKELAKGSPRLGAARGRGIPQVDVGTSFTRTTWRASSPKIMGYYTQSSSLLKQSSPKLWATGLQVQEVILGKNIPSRSGSTAMRAVSRSIDPFGRRSPGWDLNFSN